jgi:hypothetical protein
VNAGAEITVSREALEVALRLVAAGEWTPEKAEERLKGR